MMTARLFEFHYQRISFGNMDILAITRGKKIKLYRLTELKADPIFCGRAFRLDKIDEQHLAAEIRDDENHYNVLVSPKPWECRCDCLGSQQYGYCVHRLALEDMIIDEAKKMSPQES